MRLRRSPRLLTERLRTPVPDSPRMADTLRALIARAPAWAPDVLPPQELPEDLGDAVRLLEQIEGADAKEPRFLCECADGRQAWVPWSFVGRLTGAGRGWRCATLPSRADPAKLAVPMKVPRGRP